ncbi:MAG TPA: hypothetical protein VFX12_07790 [Vicinamibacterales bacterium]|nr:hypothetical protein [Vicinamibacterales bacterium]
MAKLPRNPLLGKPINRWKTLKTIARVSIRPGWNKISWEIEIETNAGKIARFVAKAEPGFTAEAVRRRLERPSAYPL